MAKQIEIKRTVQVGALYFDAGRYVVDVDALTVAGVGARDTDPNALTVGTAHKVARHVVDLLLAVARGDADAETARNEAIAHDRAMTENADARATALAAVNGAYRSRRVFG